MLIATNFRLFRIELGAINLWAKRSTTHIEKGDVSVDISQSDFENVVDFFLFYGRALDGT
jgi:hypothetical protein